MERRAAGALLALAACFACSAAAPTASNQTSLDLYEGAPEGCYYNFQHYGEGDRIMTNEPCLNCTCHNRMLMCYLRVCPFTKAIGQDCTVEKRADQCCPIVTCPDVPVDLLTSTSTTSPAEYGATGLGKLDKYGCSINGKYFPEGSKVPPTPNKPCEHCYCIRNMTTCVMQECTLHVDGCTPIYHKDVCCPVRYSCDHLEDEMPLLDDMSTTVRPTPGFLLTTTTISPVTQMTQDCVHDDQIFADGALIKTEKACEHCYCMKGDIVCVVQECGAPMENEGKNCTSLPPREGQCCPDTYICEGDELSSEIPIEATTESVMEMITTLLPPRRVGVEGSGYRNEPDEAPYTAIPTIDTEIEGSGEDQDTSKPEEGLETIPPTEDGEQFISVTKAPMFDEHKHSSTESDKNVEDQTLEPHDNVATTISSIEKATEKPVTDEVTVELKPHEHYTTTSTEKVSTEYGEFLNTVPDEVSEVDDTKSQAERTTSEPTIEGSGSPSLTENEESRTTVTSENQEVVTIAAVTSALEYNTPAVTPETMTEKESSETDKDILRTTVAKVEEYTEKSERESSTPEPLIPSSTNVPVEEDIKLTTEPDHAENTVAVAEEEITESHISKVTGVPDSYVEGEKTTVPNVEQELATEKSVKDEVLRPSELIPTASTTLEENELSTEEPDKGLNTIPNEVHEESTSAVPHLIDTKTTEPASQDVDLKQTTSLETITLTPEIMVTKGDQYTVTTEPSFRKEDEIIVSTKKPIDFVSTTVRPEFVDEGLIPTSTHDERIGSSSETTSIEEDMTTLIPEYTKEEEGSKQTTSEFIPDISVVTESVPVKHSEPSVGQEGETVSSTEKSTETTAIVVDDVETHEEPSRIPGEGDCLLNGVTYRNNSVVPSTNNCHTGCRCASSIIKCDPIICSPPPDYMDNCQSIYDSPDSCCPTYVCDHPRETVPPQSDNQMSGTESPLSSPTIECRGDQCEISEPHKPSTDRSEPCTGGSCSGETDHKLEMPHTSATCENEKDCKSLDIPVQEVTPCEGDSCKKIDCTGDNCDPNAIFVPDHTPKIPQDIPEHDCTEEPCRRKETSDTNAKIPSECDGPNCISETDIGVQDVVYSSTKSSIPMEEVTEKIEVALEEKTTTVPESPTKDTQELDSYTTEKQLYTMMPSKEEPEDSGDVDTKKPGIDDEVTEKPKVSHDADKETPIDTKETMTEKPSLVDEDIKLKPTDADEEVTYKPALTDDDEKRTSDMVDEITEKPTVTDEDSKAKPTVIEPDVTEKPALTDEDGKQKPSDTQETVTDLPALTDDGEKGSFTEIEEEITEKPSLIDDDRKVKPPVIDEDITEKPVHIDDEVKEKPTEINEEVTAKPTLTDEDDKIKSTVIDEEVTEKPTMIDDDKLKPTVIDEEVTEKPALIDDDSNEKPSVIDEEVTKKPALSGDDDITSTGIIEQVTDIPALTEADRKVTSVSAEVITAKPAIAEDDKHKPAVSDEDITGKPDLIDQDGKVQPTVIDVDVTGKPDMIAEDGKIKPTVIDEDVTDKPDLTDDDGRRKPTDTEEKITEKPSLIDEHDKIQPTVIDEDVTGKPDFIDEDGKVKPTVIDEDVTGEPNLIDEDGKVKPTVIDEDVTDKPDLINEDGKVKPTFIDEDVTGKPDLIDEDGKSKPTIIDEDVSSKPHLIDEDKTSKPTVIDEDVTRKPDLIDEDGKAKPTVIDEEVTDIPALTDDDGRRKPTEAEEKITEKPTSTDKHEKVQPTVIDEHVTDKPVQFDEDGKEKPTDTDKETTQKPILINDDGIIIPTVIDEDVTQKPALIDDGKQTPFIQEELTEKPVESDDDGKITSTMADEKPILTDEDGKIKPTFIDEDVTDKPADIQEKVTEIPALIDDDGKGSSTGIEEEVTEKPALIDDEGKIKPPVIDEDITEKPIQTDEDGKYKPSDADEKETETPVLIDDDSKGTSPAMEDNITERPAITDINVKETYTAIQEEVTEKSTLTDDNVKEKPTEIDVEVTDKPTLTDEDSKVKPTVSAEEITKKPASIDDDSQVKPTDDERVTDESINEVTKTPPTVTEEESGTKLPEIERTKPETEAPTPETSVYPTETTTSESQEVTKTPYHESSTTLAAEDEHAFSTGSYVEPADVSTSAPKESVSSESQEIGEGEYVSKIPTQSQQEPEVTTEKTYESTPNLAVTSDQAIEKETYDTTSSKQDIEEKPTTQASKLHDETEPIEITTKPTIGELEETSTDIPDLESLTTRKQEGGPVEIEPQEGPADDKHKQPESGSIDDEITTKMYDEGKIKPVPESHVTEQAMAVTPAYDNVSDLPEQPVQVSKLPEIQENQKKTPEIPDSDKTKDEEYVTEKDKTITETPISSAAVTTEQHISLETQKVSDEGTSTTIKSYLPETGSTELPDKAIGEDLEHSTQTSEAHKDKPDILTDATEEPISVVTGSQEMFPASEKDMFSHGDKITSVPDVTDQIHKGTTPMEEYTQEPDGVTKPPQYHVTTEETHSKAPDTYITDEYVTGYPESSTKSDGLKEVDSETIPTEITRTSEKTEETTQPGILFTESHDHGMKDPSVTEMQEQSTKLPITSEDLETKQPGLQLTSESPQSLVTEHSETTTSIFKEDSHEPELVTTQVLETTKATELPVSVSVQEELQTEAPVSMTEHGVKETATEITEEIGKVTKVPEETVTEKQETLTTLRESSFPSQEEQTEKPQVDTKPHETTESQAETSETTTDLIILEEHTHKIVQDITTELPTENEVTDKTGDISTLSSYEEHTPKVTEHISSESPIDEERTTVHSDIEHQYPELTTEKTPEKEIEVATKETEVEVKPSEETPIEEGVTEKVLDTVAIEETTVATVQDADSKYTVAQKEYTTSAPIQISEETTPESITEPAITSVSETDIIGSSTKQPSVTEKPTHETTVPEDEIIFSTTKATTVRQGEEISDDKVAKPEDRPTETSEVPPTSTTAEVQKPSITDTQPTEKIPEPEEEFPSMGPNGYGEPDYVEEDQAFGPGTCRYGGKVYVSAQQIPRDDPCDFCFCFRSDIICLQQSCPPPIHGCHEEPIQGFCCPRYECPVSMATTVNVTTTTTTTTTTLPPHFPTHSYKGQAQRRGCQIKGHTYKVGEVVRSSSGPCLHCTCGGDGQMKCDPKACTPEPMLRQMIAAAVSAKRRR